MTLSINKMYGCVHINTVHHEWVLKKTILTTEGLTERRNNSFIKVSGRMRSGAFKKGQPSASQQ